MKWTIIVLIFSHFTLIRWANGVPPLEWLGGIDITKAPVESYKQVGKTRTKDDCALRAKGFAGFDSNAFMYMHDYECIALKINTDQDFEEGIDVIYIIDGPWSCPAPYYYKLTPKRWTPLTWEAAHVTPAPTNMQATASTQTTTTTTATTTTTTTTKDLGSKQRVLVVGGRESKTKSVLTNEVLPTADDGDGGSTCDNLGDYPVEEAFFPTGGLLGGDKPIACGGGNNSNAFNPTWNQCFNVRTGQKFASMSEKRAGAASIVIGNQQQLWITGGRNAEADNLKSTEFIDHDGNVRNGPDLQLAVYFHCLVKLNDTTAFLIGGRTNKQRASDQTFLLDLDYKEGSLVTKDGPRLSIGRRVHMCGHVRFQSTGEMSVVVTGGVAPKPAGRQASTDMLSMDNGQLAVNVGPNLPRKLSAAGSVSLDDGTFLVIGGVHDVRLRTVLKLACQLTLSDCQWTLMKQELKVPRNDHLAILIPSWMTNCG